MDSGQLYLDGRNVCMRKSLLRAEGEEEGEERGGGGANEKAYLRCSVFMP